MKKLFVSAVVVAALTGMFATAVGQNRAGNASSAGVPHKIGLIDMARVFKEYKKFATLREDLKHEFEKSQGEAKAQAVQLQQLREQLKTFEPGSPEFVEREKQITKLSAELQAFAQVTQRDLMRREADIYKTIYLEVADVVKQYAEYYDYTLVIRFNGESLDSANPQEILQRLNRKVVYHREDDDITVPVLKYLNREYQKQANAAGPARTRQASAGSAGN